MDVTIVMKKRMEVHLWIMFAECYKIFPNRFWLSIMSCRKFSSNSKFDLMNSRKITPKLNIKHGIYIIWKLCRFFAIITLILRIDKWTHSRSICQKCKVNFTIFFTIFSKIICFLKNVRKKKPFHHNNKPLIHKFNELRRQIYELFFVFFRSLANQIWRQCGCPFQVW